MYRGNDLQTQCISACTENILFCFVLEKHKSNNRSDYHINGILYCALRDRRCKDTYLGYLFSLAFVFDRMVGFCVCIRYVLKVF